VLERAFEWEAACWSEGVGVRLTSVLLSSEARL